VCLGPVVGGAAGCWIGDDGLAAGGGAGGGGWRYYLSGRRKMRRRQGGQTWIHPPPPPPAQQGFRTKRDRRTAGMRRRTDGTPARSHTRDDCSAAIGRGSSRLSMLGKKSEGSCAASPAFTSQGRRSPLPCVIPAVS